jgi:hypothetical protein
MTPVEKLLSRLDSVRRTGKDKWTAKCPTRADKHPSLTIRELPDGRVLMHDFGGDSVNNILSAVGLEMSDLYPPRLEAPGPGKVHRERRPLDPLDVLRVLDFEVQLVQVFASDMLAHKPIENFDRLKIAVDRITDARGMYAG